MRFPSFTFNTSIFTFSLNNETRNWGKEYICLQLFGIDILNIHKQYSSGRITRIEECPDQPHDIKVVSFLGLTFSSRRHERSGTYQTDQLTKNYLLSIGFLVLVGLAACYALNHVKFLFVLLPPFNALLSMSLYELPVFLANAKILISLCRAFISSIWLTLSLKLKGYTPNKKSIILILRGFFVPDLICALVSVPVTLYTPYGFWAAIASIAICSVLKALSEGGAVFRLSLFPHLSISLLEFVVQPISALISLMRCSLIAIDFRVGVPHDISEPAAKALQYTDWAYAADKVLLTTRESSASSTL